MMTCAKCAFRTPSLAELIAHAAEHHPEITTAASRRQTMKRTPIKRSPLLARRTAVKRKRATPRRVSVDRDPVYLQEIRLCFCTVGMLHGSEGCSMITDAAHGPVNGIGSKGADSGAIPLCRRHHLQQHAIGWKAFEAKYGFSRAEEAAMLHALYRRETGEAPKE